MNKEQKTVLYRRNSETVRCLKKNTIDMNRGNSNVLKKISSNALLLTQNGFLPLISPRLRSSHRPMKNLDDY